MIHIELTAQNDIFQYLDLLKIKIQNFFSIMNDELLLKASVKHTDVTFLDIILSQIRHIQINIGYCNEKFNIIGIKSPEWLGYNEESIKDI